MCDTDVIRSTCLGVKHSPTIPLVPNMGTRVPTATGPVAMTNVFHGLDYTSRFADFVHPPPLSTITGQLVKDLIPTDCNQDCNLDVVVASQNA
jgi:hypothetical protein